MRNRLLIALLPLGLAACDSPAPDAAEPAQTELPQEAARRACIAAALVRLSDQEVETIGAGLDHSADAGSGASADMTRQAQLAALRFARTLQQHAELRYGGFAHADSALNHARTSADSARQMDRARRFATHLPEAGTLERNVVEAYDRRFTEMYRDEDHRCNWDL